MLGEDPGRRAPQDLLGPGGRQRRMAQVVGQVEVRILDPHRPTEAERHEADLLAIAGHQIELRGHHLVQPLERRCVALEDARAADVHGVVRTLDVEERGVHRAHRVHWVSLPAGQSADPSLKRPRLCAERNLVRVGPLGVRSSARQQMSVPVRRFAQPLAAVVIAALLLLSWTLGAEAARPKLRTSGFWAHHPLPAYALAHPSCIGGACGSDGIHKIRHVIIIMQENRSFDSYFGTYPGADGIPMRNGVPTVCVPNPAGGCTRPYHDRADINGGGPHGIGNEIADVDRGKMDGFIQQRDAAHKSCQNPDDPACTHGRAPDVMGYHTAAEIPNYWTYARDFVLQDHMFEAVRSWSLPEHLFMVSGWSAKCRTESPMSCRSNSVGPYNVPQMEKAVKEELATGKTNIDLAWTDITWLLHRHHVSWAYYIK